MAQSRPGEGVIELSENQANFFADERGFTFNLSVVAFLHHLVILHRGLWFVQLSAKGRGLHSVFLFIYLLFFFGGGEVKGQVHISQ